MLTVYKASAGSGKTFQLVAEYLKLVIKAPYQYKHILAVTFTNKATGEMKNRILQQLDLLTNDKKSPYLQLLSSQLNIAEKTVQQRAKMVLKYLVHDFNRFSISTIDSFTQKIIKSFNREVGISPQFNLELNESLILDEAIDRLLAKMDKDKNLLEWISGYAEEKVQNNLSHKIESNLKTLGQELAKEHFQLFISNATDNVYDKKKLIDFQKTLQKEVRIIEQTVHKKGKQFLESIQEHGYTIADFAYKKSGIAGYFVKMYNKIVELPTKRALAAQENGETWISKSHKEKATLLNLVENYWQPILDESIEYINRKYELYNSAILVLKNLRVLGILTDLKSEIQAIMQERGGLQISDSNLLLNKIIDNSDSPFIYEKIGNHFKNFMLDEFQDTSAMQWMNFKPLLINSMAEKNNNLLVGDVKQSIYRFRNSDWNILAKQVKNEFTQFDYLEQTLASNWRSERNIVDFNNQIFDTLKDDFGELIKNNFNVDENIDNYVERLNYIYDNFQQKSEKKSDSKLGYININFLEHDDFEAASLQKVVEQIKHLQDNGIKASETVILIRKKNEATPIINHFLEIAGKDENKKYNFSIISNESLFLNSSKGVAFVINIIQYFTNPDNEITKAALLYSWLKWLKPKNTITKKKESQYLLDFDNNNADFEWTADYNLHFQQELGEHIQAIKSKISINAIDESIILICKHFNLFSIVSELPFLQTLIDQATAIKKQVSNDFTSFLNWWEEEGQKISVNINDDIDSIRIMTVHKSKGLEFEAVILPFLNWNTSWEIPPTIWCQSSQEPFNRFAALPIKAGKMMVNSYFKNSYFDELFNNYIDTLNLTYVAFTRAKSALIINCKERKETSKIATNINEMLQNSIETIVNNKMMPANWIEKEGIFTYGQLPKLKDEETTNNSINIKNYVFDDINNKVQLKINSDNFISIDERNQSKRNIGNIIHQILAEIETTQDIEKACKKALLHGLIDENDYKKILLILQDRCNSETVKSWFDGSYQVMNERTLLTPNALLRPDRIMTDDSNTIVVDYKWGEKKPSHIKQVKTYVKTLQSIGLKNVTGYLWYLSNNIIEVV